jgi:hypothetical protein
MKKTAIPYFKERKELFDFLIEHKELLIAEKKYFPKYGDGIPFINTFYDTKSSSYKANMPVDVGSKDELKVKLAINTTKILDSHLDVHIDGLWKKSLSENKNIKHLQEHEMKFDKIIADKQDLSVYTEKLTWKELGFKFKGDTEALIFESSIKKSRNAFMFEQYAKGYVDNHSVGMQYVQYVMCISDPAYGAEFEAWEKYFPMIVNADVAESVGYFWAVKEGKVIEGSAVPLGSNYATPTLDNNMKSSPGLSHEKNPPEVTTGLNYDYLLENI